MTKKQLADVKRSFTDAHEKLTESISVMDSSKKSEHYSVFEDAVIKRFEVAFEYFWKFLKMAAEYEGSEAQGPRQAIQEAIKFKWIDDPEFWAEALDARNGSVHDYFGLSRSEYLKIVRKFAKDSIMISDKPAHS